MVKNYTLEERETIITMEENMMHHTIRSSIMMLLPIKTCQQVILLLT